MKKILAYIRSLFTDEPQHYKDAWYFRRGKRISEYQLLLEKHTEQVKQFRKRITEGPNIHVTH